MAKSSFLERLQTHMFDNKIEEAFDADEQQMIVRYRAAYTKWYSEPMSPKRTMVRFLMNEFGISESQAYRDIVNIEIVLGNVNVAAKEFHRHAANEFVRQAAEIIQTALSNFELKKAEAMIKAANALVDINKLKTDDNQDFRWKEIKPVNLEVTSNVEDANIKRKIPKNQLEAKKQMLRKKYFDDVEILNNDNDTEDLPE